jgi:ferredoxin-NADP reductase
LPFHELVLPVTTVRRATPATRIVRLDLGRTRFRFRPGQAALIGLAGGPQRVPYSIASAPEEVSADHHLEFLIKVEPSGRWGHLFDRIARGQRIAVSAPFGSFVFPPRTGSRTLLFIAGGTGIAPIRSMIAHAIHTAHPGRLRLLYSARTAADFAYLRELRRLRRTAGLELRLHVTREAPAGWRGERGRIAPAHLAPLVDPGRTLSFVCGPAAMVADVPLMLTELGVPARHVRLEKWAS